MEYLYDSRIVWWCVVHFTVQPQASQASAFCLSALFETFCRINDWPKAWALENPCGTSPWACNALQCLPCQACICTDNAAPNHEASGCKCTQVPLLFDSMIPKQYTPGYQIPSQVFTAIRLLEPCRCLAVDAATDPTPKRSKVGSHSMLEAAKKKRWCIRLIRLCQIIHLQATVRQEERRGVTEYQLYRYNQILKLSYLIIRYYNNQIIIRYISHQDIKSFHGETIQMRSSPFSAWRSLLCLGLRLKNRLNSLNVDLTSTLLRVITHKPSHHHKPQKSDCWANQVDVAGGGIKARILDPNVDSWPSRHSRFMLVARC